MKNMRCSQSPIITPGAGGVMEIWVTIMRSIPRCCSSALIHLNSHRI